MEQVVRALDTMSSEHVAIEGLVGELAPLWAAASLKTASAADIAQALGTAKELEALLGRHLALEEAHVFPAFGALDAEATAAVVAEIKERRQRSGVKGQ
jgi:hypothetical protein